MVINTYLTTCFGSSETSSGQYFIYGHGASVSSHIMGSHIVYKQFVNNMGSHNVRTH